jgi:hypothetical protein
MLALGMLQGVSTSEMVRESYQNRVSPGLDALTSRSETVVVVDDGLLALELQAATPEKTFYLAASDPELADLCRRLSSDDLPALHIRWSKAGSDPVESQPLGRYGMLTLSSVCPGDPPRRETPTPRSSLRLTHEDLEGASHSICYVGSQRASKAGMIDRSRRSPRPA